MKKLISILLLSLYLVSTTELYQFLKIPVLIEHYLEHKEQNPKLTIGSFFKIHYDNPVKDSDYTTDQKLPFVSHEAHFIIVCTPATPFTFQLSGKESNTIIVSKQTFYKSIFYNKDILNSIWQPPKSCWLFLNSSQNITLGDFWYLLVNFYTVFFIWAAWSALRSRFL